MYTSPSSPPPSPSFHPGDLTSLMTRPESEPDNYFFVAESDEATKRRSAFPCCSSSPAQRQGQSFTGRGCTSNDNQAPSYRPVPLNARSSDCPAHPLSAGVNIYAGDRFRTCSLSVAGLRRPETFMGSISGRTSRGRSCSKRRTTATFPA